MILLFSLLLACGGKDEDTGGGANSATVCIDEDLGSSVEYDLATATPSGDDYQIMSCDGVTVGTDGKDHGFTWTAPATGGYTFSTVGSTYNTVLVVLADDCLGQVLACNDDYSADVQQSEVYLSLDEGQRIVLVVDGYDTYSSGTLQLKVLQDL